MRLVVNRFNEDGIIAFNDYSDRYTIRIDSGDIEVEIRKSGKKEAEFEYWQPFSKWHWIRDDEHELRKVSEFKSFEETDDGTECDKEKEEYKKKEKERKQWK